jgi:hypothetical protein
MMTWFLGTSRKPPLYQLRFQFTIIVENHLFDYNLFFSIADQKSQKVQVENEIIVESDNHVSTPHINHFWPF